MEDQVLDLELLLVEHGLKVLNLLLILDLVDLLLLQQFLNFVLSLR